MGNAEYMGTVSSVSQTEMKVFFTLLCVSLTATSIVKREAEPSGYGSEPQCTVTPVKQCVPRIVETPKEVCQTVVDKHEDTVVTETCEEEITTTCVQVSTTKHRSSKVVDTSTALVETGVPKGIETKSVKHTSGYHKREADPIFDLKLKLPFLAKKKKASRPQTRTYTRPHPRPVTTHHVTKPVVYSAPAPKVYSAPAPKVYSAPAPAPVVYSEPEPTPVVESAPLECTSTPVKTCSNTPVTKQRKVPRVICETVVDITHVEDCTETITKNCASSSTSQTSNSRVIGHDIQVISGGSGSGGSSSHGSGYL